MAQPTDNSQKAFLLTEKGDKIYFLFNPEQLSFSRSVTWSGSSKAGQEIPLLTYGGGGSQVLTLSSLFFDTTDTGQPVTVYTDKLQALTEIAQLSGDDEKTNNAQPPWVEFHWGDFSSAKSVITSLNFSFTYFSSTGTPLRATAGMTLTQLLVPLPPQNPTSGTPRPHRVHRVQPGETLDRIAAVHLGDATKWRSIAEVNVIEDPLALRPGRILAIPALY
jgi:hypothetical protein